MRSVLERGDHRCGTVESASEAWTFIQENPLVDLVFVELSLKRGSGIDLIRRMASDSQLKFLPVVVYTARGDRNAVRACLDLKVQNFLIKPYEDDTIFAEIARATMDPWRAHHFEEEKSFCKMTGWSCEELHERMAAVRREVDKLVPDLQGWANTPNQHAPETTGLLLDQAEAVGAWGVVEALNAIMKSEQLGVRSGLPAQVESLAFAGKLIDFQLGRKSICAGFVSEEERLGEEEARGLAHWLDAPAEERCPVVEPAKLRQQLEALNGYPVIEPAAASFRMAATGERSCINPLMDLVARDSGLSAQIIAAATRARQHGEEDFNLIEDARYAVSQLGEKRLKEQARLLCTVPERVFEVSPVLDWTQYWMFQRGVARVAQKICQQLEFHSMEALARSAGEIHDVGKLIFAFLYPHGFRAVIEHARRNDVSLSAAETLLLGETTNRMAAGLGSRHGLSPRLVDVMRWIDDPIRAGENRYIVAVVSLAREYCERYRLGASGEPRRKSLEPVTEHCAWQVLEEAVFPSFQLDEFENQIKRTCREVRREMSGENIKPLKIP